MKKTYFEPTSKDNYYFVYLFSLTSLVSFMSLIGEYNVQIYELSDLHNESYEIVVSDLRHNLGKLVSTLNS